MALELRQQLKLSQQLVMTPQLQQAIRLLQLSRLELVETVQRELLENPFLEEMQDEPSNEPPAEVRPESPRDEPTYDREVARSEDWEDYLGEFASTPQQVQPRDYELPEEMSSLEARYASSPTLESHLMWQLRLSSLSDDQKELGEISIGNLSSSGYLQASLEEMAEMARADFADGASTAEAKDKAWPTAEEVATVLKAIQLFDPVGVAARTPQECLLIQIKALGYDRDQVLVDLVRDHLEDLEDGIAVLHHRHRQRGADHDADPVQSHDHCLDLDSLGVCHLPPQSQYRTNPQPRGKKDLLDVTDDQSEKSSFSSESEFLFYRRFNACHSPLSCSFNAWRITSFAPL